MLDRTTLSQIIHYIDQRIQAAFIQFTRGKGGFPSAASAMVLNLSDAKPTVIYPSAALSQGSGIEAAHYDHQHSLYSDAAPRDVGDTNIAGSSSHYVAKGDHGHRIGGTAGGDLSGSFPTPQVAGLRGRGVSSSAPSFYDALTYYGGVWQPLPTNAGGASALTVEEQDGTPSVGNVVRIKVSNASLTNDGGGVVSLAAGGASDVVNAAAKSYAYQYFR